MMLLRLVLLGLCLTGCAARSATCRPSELRRLRSQLGALRVERADQASTITELRNRIFILEDRVDTNRVEMSRQLPVVRLAPMAAAPAVEEAEEPPAEVAEDVDDGRPRPVLKLYERRPYYGGGPPRAPLSPIPSAQLGSHDALPVMPMDGMPEPGSARLAPRTPAAPSRSEAVSGQDADGEALAGYEAAFSLFRARRFDEALVAFAEFRDRYPQHSYADNAVYWRGECYYAKRDYRSALSEFESVYARYPNGNKAPDAMLKAAYSRAELGDVARARAALFRIVELFPRSDAARLAAERAARLGSGSQVPAGAGEVRP